MHTDLLQINILLKNKTFTNILSKSLKFYLHFKLKSLDFTLKIKKIMKPAHLSLFSVYIRDKVSAVNRVF